MATATASVYRCYDAEDQLLYIGMSSGPETRLNEGHRYRSAWYGDMARWTQTPRMAWADAIRTEHLAIQAEKPIHNRRARWAPKFMREADQ
jgi:predicted GIY-YIG superfamily endonuclease